MTVPVAPILISGAGCGAGALTAERLAEDGARLFLIDRNPNRCKAVAGRTGGYAAIGEIADQRTVERAVNAATIAGGGLAAWVHAIPLAAGVGFAEIRPAELHRAFAAEVASLQMLGATAFRAMRLRDVSLMLRLDFVTASNAASERILRAAQDAVWEEIAETVTPHGVQVRSLEVPSDEQPVETAERVREVVVEVFGHPAPGDESPPAEPGASEGGASLEHSGSAPFDASSVDGGGETATMNGAGKPARGEARSADGGPASAHP